MMTVFYSEWPNGKYCYSFCQYLGDLVCDADVSYWMPPLSVDDMWELED